MSTIGHKNASSNLANLTGSGTFSCNTPVTYYSSPTNFTYPEYIYADDYLIHRAAIQLVKDELSAMENINPEEINKLIGSTNKEDFDLSMNMLEMQGGIYSVKILRSIRDNYPNTTLLRAVMQEWYQKNYLNVTNRYI